MEQNYLKFTDYTLENFASITSEAFNNNSQKVIPGIEQKTFYRMFGFDFLEDSEDGPIAIKSPADFLNNDTERSYRLTTFWESPVNFSTLGNYFYGFFQNTTGGGRGFNSSAFNEGNILATYLSIFILKSNLTLVDPITNKVIDMLDNSSRDDFSFVINNLILFLDSSQGMGNVNFRYGDDGIVTANPKVGSLKMNYGFIQKYCKNVEKNYCFRNKIEGENCTTKFRQEMSNNKELSNLCGCYAPLPAWMNEEFQKAQVQEPNNRCDYFCFQSATYKLVYKPGEGGNDYRRRCDDSTICVMDLTNININNNEGGNILFEQICNCPNGMLCQCFLEVSDQAKGLLDNVQDNRGRGMLSEINYRQHCSTTTCYTVDEEGNQQVAECNKISPPRTAEINDENSNGLTQIEKYKEVNEIFWIVIIIVSISIIVYLFTFLEITFSKNIK